MKVAVFFAAICIFALVMPQAYAEEEDETAVREARGAKGVCDYMLMHWKDAYGFALKYKDILNKICLCNSK